MSALQLFCLPHSAGSAMFYRRWSESLPEWIQVRPLALPGTNVADEQPVDIGSLARQLAGECMAAQQPCVLFGHGLGGLLAFELAHVLRMSGMAEPLALFVSGIVAPPRCDFSQGACTDTWLGDAQSCGEPAGLQRFGGYDYCPRVPLRSSIHVLGRKQGGIKVEALLDWQQETRGDFSLDMLERHHFYIQQQEARVLRLVCRYCERHLRHWSLARQRAAG